MIKPGFSHIADDTTVTVEAANQNTLIRSDANEGIEP